MPAFAPGTTIPNQTYVVNRAIATLNLPRATGGDGTLAYSISPALPAGLSFDAAARTITGTPTTAVEATTYTYTVTDSDATNPDSDTLTFTITVVVSLPLPATPAGVSGTKLSNERVVIDWDDAAHAAGYRIQMWDPGNLRMFQLPSAPYTLTCEGIDLSATTRVCTESMATVDGLGGADHYSFFVRSWNASGQSGWSRPAWHAVYTEPDFGIATVDDQTYNVPPVRVENAFPAIVSAQEFKRVARSLGSRAPGSVHPRRIASPYLLSGLLKCERCGRALSASESGRGRYTYYVCHSLLNRGKGTCTTPRLSAKRFERLIVEQIREHILTESNMRDLVRMVNEEMDSVIAGERERLEAAELELREVRQRMNRLWELVEKTEMTVEDILPRIRHHQENQERLERAADEARVELDARLAGVQDAEVVAAYAREMGEWLLESGLAETKAFLRTFVKEIVVRPGHATIHYTVPTPDDSPIGGADVAEVALGRRFMKSVSRRDADVPRR